MTVARQASLQQGSHGDPQDEPPPDFIPLAEAAKRLGVSDETLRRRYQPKYGPPRIQVWRNSYGRVFVNIAKPPDDLVALGQRPKKATEAAAEVEEGGALAVLRRHVFWLESRLDAMAAEATQERSRAHEERQRLLVVIERLTGRPTE
jgi:hypothetical protein